MSIDTAQILNEIEVRAEVALREAAEFTLGRAKHHAPVRAIFKRRRRGTAYTGKGGITTAAAYKKFRKSKERRSRVDLGQAPRGAESLVETGLAQQSGGVRGRGGTSSIPNVGKPRTRTAAAPGERGQLVSQSIGREARQYGRTTSFSGHSNSLIPVIKSRHGYNFTGDLRRVGPVGAGLIQHQDSRQGSTPKVVKASRVEKVRQSRLSSRGRYEVKQAVKGNRGLFNGRVGGRLRGEIRLTPIKKRGSVLWIYVEAPTDYAYWQEFGNSRHRAQPFLRPALYESRPVLRSSVGKIGQVISGGAPVGKPPRTAGASSPVTPGRPGPEGGGGALL